MVRNLPPLENLLTPRRKEFSNFAWTLRKLQNTVPCKHTVTTTPQTLKTNVLYGDKMQEIIRKLSQEREIPMKELEDQLKEILDEIGFNHDMFVIRSLAIFLVKVNCKLYKGIHVNGDHIRNLKANMGNTPIIYVPNHRSYADFITMSYVFFSMDIAIPAIAAGMDFHGMWGMGTVLRNTGAFFMRRSYNNDSLYWETFREYVHQLIMTIDCGVEFFIEGMRSRSSKSVPPKFGLLFMLLKAFFTGEVPDILFVPIGISYDRVVEEKLFGFELLGVPKPKESTSGFFKSFSILKENYGNIYLNFGEPISSREFFGTKMNRLKHTMKPLHMQELHSEEKAQIVHFAESIVHSQQELIIITTINLIAVILTNSLMKRENIMRLNELVMEVMWLNNVIESFGAMANIENPRRSVEDALNVHNHLIRLDEESNVTLLQNKVVLGNYDPKRLKGHALTEKTMTLAVPFIMLQIYVNPTMHYFINYSILVSIFSHSEQHITKDRLYEEYIFLRTLLTNEFTLFEYRAKEDYTIALERLIQMDAINTDGSNYSLGRNNKVQVLLRNLLKPFLYSYYIVCYVLIEKQQEGFPEKGIMAAAQETIENIITTEPEFTHPYTLSLDTLTNCLQSLVKLRALTKYRFNEANAYDTDNNVLLPLLNKIEIYVHHKLRSENVTTVQLRNKL